MKKNMITALLIIGLVSIEHDVFGQQRTYRAMIDDFVSTWETKAHSYLQKSDNNVYIYWIFVGVGVIATIVTALNKKTAATILAIIVTSLTQVSRFYDIQPQKYQWAGQRILADLERFKESTRDLDLSDPQIGQEAISKKQDLLIAFEKIEDEFINLKMSSLRRDVELPPELVFQFASLIEDPSLCSAAKLNPVTKRFEAGPWSYPLSTSLINDIQTDKNNLYLASIGTGSSLDEAFKNERSCANNNLREFVLRASGQTSNVGQKVAIDVTDDIQKQLHEIWFKYEQKNGVYASCRLYQLPRKFLNSYYTNYNDVNQRSTRVQNERFIQKIKAEKIIKQ